MNLTVVTWLAPSAFRSPAWPACLWRATRRHFGQVVQGGHVDPVGLLVLALAFGDGHAEGGPGLAVFAEAQSGVAAEVADEGSTYPATALPLRPHVAATGGSRLPLTST